MKRLSFVLFSGLLACNATPDLPNAHEAGWKGETVSEIIHEDATMRVLKCTFAPGVGHEKHYHQPHFGYTLKGSKFKITDNKGTKTVDVPTGTKFNKDDIYIHEVLNVGDSTAVFLIFEPK